jgi:PAS domain S-box-containing protein
MAAAAISTFLIARLVSRKKSSGLGAYLDLEKDMRERTEQLSQYQRQYQELENTVDGIVWEAHVGQSGYTFVSRQAERLLGYPIERWLTQVGFWQSILHPEDRSRLTGDVYQGTEQKKDSQNEYRVITSEGRTLWMRDQIKVIYEAGAPAKMRGIMVDITERKLTEAKIKEAQQEAVEAARVKSDFLANMSHEIRTPLNAIIGMAAVVMDTEMDEKQMDCIKTIKSAGDSLLSLINDILDFSKIEAGKVELEPGDFRVAALCRSAAEVVGPSARGKGVEMEWHLAPDVPQDLRGDAGRLLQVLMNLMGNAVKFTPTGGKVTLKVLAASPPAATGHRLRLEVIDTGVGVPQDMQSKLFKPFTQADASTARRFGGTGLGLSICKRLVDLMGGQIGLVSEEGKGSTFWFEVTLVAALAPVVDAPAEPVVVNWSPSNRRILVVDDNPANQKVMMRLLEKLGYRSEAVGNGREALDLFLNGKYDLILMDCQMPEMDGYEATRRIRVAESASKRTPTPVVALTAHAMAGDREKCRLAGMDDYLPKPVGLEQLDRTLVRWLSRAQGPLEASKILPPMEPVKGDASVPLDPNFIRKLDDLQMEGQPDIVVELAEIFLRTAPERLTLIEQAVGASDFETIGKTAHTFKSTCHSVGAFRLAEMCQEMEKNAKASQAVDRLLEKMLVEVNVVSGELRALVEGRGVSV